MSNEIKSPTYYQKKVDNSTTEWYKKIFKKLILEVIMKDNVYNVLNMKMLEESFGKNPCKIVKITFLSDSGFNQEEMDKKYWEIFDGIDFSSKIYKNIRKNYLKSDEGPTIFIPFRSDEYAKTFMKAIEESSIKIKSPTYYQKIVDNSTTKWYKKIFEKLILEVIMKDNVYNVSSIKVLKKDFWRNQAKTNLYKIVKITFQFDFGFNQEEMDKKYWEIFDGIDFSSKIYKNIRENYLKSDEGTTIFIPFRSDEYAKTFIKAIEENKSFSGIKKESCLNVNIAQEAQEAEEVEVAEEAYVFFSKMSLMHQ